MPKHNNQFNKKRLATLLLDCPCIKDVENRQLLLTSLPKEISESVKGNNSTKGHVLNIVNTCSDYPGGLEALVDSIHFFDKGTEPFQKLNQFRIDALKKADTVPQTKTTGQSFFIWILFILFGWFGYNFFKDETDSPIVVAILPIVEEPTIPEFVVGESFNDSFKNGRKGPEMVVIPAGTFQMGDIQDTGAEDEKPVHEVSVKQFAIGVYEVTVNEFWQFVEATNYKTEAEKGDGCVWKDGKSRKQKNANWYNSYFPQKDNQPVVCVSWNDAVAYTEWLSQQTDKQYGLPSEAEWEYAARAGTKTDYWGGNEIGKDNANCWKDLCGDSFEYTAPKSSFDDNKFGLYDTVGNVWEWCADGYQDNYNDAPDDGSVWKKSSKYRVLRGGSWVDNPNSIRAANRDRSFPVNRYNYVGFRVVRRLVART